MKNIQAVWKFPPPVAEYVDLRLGAIFRPRLVANSGRAIRLVPVTETMKFTDFGFKENPFTITPDPRYLYLSRGHEESLAHLIYGTGPNGGFVLLTGEVGTGKTLLIRSLLAQKLTNVDIALVLNPRLSRREFLATICDELDVQYPGPPYSLKQLSDALARHLLKIHGEGRHTVLVVDEAQNLSPRVLEQVRLLTNLETTRHKLLRIILVGQPELLQILEQKELRQVDQRITARYHLTPLNRQETVHYIAYRLAVAGIREDLFTPTALRLVHHFSGGIPRRINTLCERTLLAIFSRGKARVGGALVWRSAMEISGARHRSCGRWRWPLLGVSLLLVIGLALYAYYPTPDLQKRSVAAQDLPQSTSVPQTSTASSSILEGEPSSGGSRSEVTALSNTVQKPTATGDGLAERATLKAEPPVGRAPPLSEFNLSASFDLPQNKERVYEALFALWGVAINPNSPQSPCMQASGRGLRCFIDKTDWAGVLEIDRPIILRLTRGKSQRLILLKRIDGERLVIDAGEGDTQLAISRLQSSWDGEFVLLWRPPEGVALIGEGSAGTSVTWLRKRMQLADGAPIELPEGVDRFDKRLRFRLEAFQRSKGLLADGVAGQQTLIYLNNLLLPPGTPTLQPIAGRGGN